MVYTTERCDRIIILGTFGRIIQPRENVSQSSRMNLDDIDVLRPAGAHIHALHGVLSVHEQHHCPTIGWTWLVTTDDSSTIPVNEQTVNVN